MVPPPTAVARPLLEVVATPGVPDVQVVIILVMSELVVEPSAFLNVPVAVYCWVKPTLIVLFAGVRAMEVS